MAETATRNPERDGENGWGMCFVVTKPFRPDQLMGELAAALNWRKVSGCVVDGDPAVASASSPATLWVDRTDLDPAVLQRVASAHQASQAWVAKGDEPTFSEVAEKVARGEALTPQEQQIALRSLIASAGDPGKAHA